MYWDIQFGIKWYDSDCATVGKFMLDFVMNGDMRKWPNARYEWWNGDYMPPGFFKPPRISLNDRLYTQGWATERLRTTMHEGFHHRGMAQGIYRDETQAAAAFEDRYVNW